MTDLDLMNPHWWVTVASGTDSWQDDYTRHRSGEMTYTGVTYSGITDMYNHEGENRPTDIYCGRQDGHTGRELDSGKY